VDSIVTVTGGMTLNGVATVGAGSATASVPARLEFSGTQSVDGSGEIVFVGDNTGEGFVRPVAGGVVTMTGLTLRGANSSSGDGTLGGPNGTLAFGGTWVPGAPGSRIEIAGEIDSAGDTITLEPGAGGEFVLDGGAIRNAIVAGTGTLDANQGAGALENVTLGANLRLGVDSIVTVTGGMTLNGVATVGAGSATASVPARLEFSGTQTVDGSGEIIFVGENSSEAFVRPVGVSTVTFGPSTTIQGGRGTLGGPGGTVVVQGTFMQGEIVFGGTVILP
jgi:hypothetical protein